MVCRYLKLLVLAFIVSFQQTEAFLPNGKCSFVEYMTSTMMCWDSFAFKLMFDSGAWKSPGYPGNKYPAGGKYPGSGDWDKPVLSRSKRIPPPRRVNWDPVPPNSDMSQSVNSFNSNYPPKYQGPYNRPPKPRHYYWGINEENVLNMFSKLCTDGSVSFALNCQADVDEKCQGSFFDNAKLKKIADMLCANITQLTDLLDCVGYGEGVKLMNCVRSVQWYHTDSNTLCTVTTAVKSCMEGVFSRCGDELRPAMVAMMDGVILKACSKEKTEKTCSAIEYALSAGMCLAPPVMSIIRPLYDKDYDSSFMSSFGSGGSPSNSYMSRTISLGKEFMSQCSLGRWTHSLNCMHRVDQECGFSFINPIETKLMMESLCKDLMKLGELQGCIQYGSFDLMGQCLLNYKSPGVDGDRVCSGLSHFRKCYHNLFDYCGDPPKSTMYMMADLAIPKPCSTATHQATAPTCTMVEFLMSHGMCWYKLANKIMWALKQRGPYRPPHQGPYGSGSSTKSAVQLHIKMLCEEGDMEESLRCHEESESMCGYSFVNHKRLKLAVDATCKNIDKMPLLELCIHQSKFYSLMVCLKDITVNVKPSDIACTVTQRYMMCFKKMFEGCQEDIRKTVATYINMMLIDPCTDQTQYFENIDDLQIAEDTTSNIIEMEKTTTDDGVGAGVMVKVSVTFVLFLVGLASLT